MICNWKWSNEEDWKLLLKIKTQDVYYSLGRIVYYKAPFSKMKIYSSYYIYIYIYGKLNPLYRFWNPVLQVSDLVLTGIGTSPLKNRIIGIGFFSCIGASLLIIFVLTSSRIVSRFVSCYASLTSGEAYRNRRLTTNFELWVEIFCVPTCFQMRIPKPCLSVCPSVCLSICPYPEKRNHPSFVNVSPTLVIDTSMERSSLVLHHGNPKIWIFFQKSLKFEFWFLTKSWNHLSFVNISPTLVIDTSMERSSRVLHHGNLKIWIFCQKSLKFEFWLSKNSWNHHSFVKISPTLVIDTSMERPSWVGYYTMGTQKFEFFAKNVRNSNFNFQRTAEITIASSISVLH